MSNDLEIQADAATTSQTEEYKLPEFMKAAQGKAFGSIDGQISFTDKLAVPKLDPKDTKRLLAKVHAVSVAPGDVRVLKGHCRYVQTPPTGFPYVPGGDFSGEVVKVPEPNETGFEVGDKIISLFEEPRPCGALREFAVVKGEFCAKRPKNTSAVEAACLLSSALSAMIAVERHVKKGDRVLVVNGAGGVGVHMVQLLKQFGASYVATISTQEDLMMELGADRNVDYTKEKWSEIDDFHGDNRFDLVMDLWGSPEPWNQAKSSIAVKSKSEGGRFLTFIGDAQYPIVHGVVDFFPMGVKIMGRSLSNKLSRWQPKYLFLEKALTVENGNLHRLSERVENGELKPIMDPRSPFPFTLEGVKDAFKLQESRHAHGKVIVEVSKE